MNESTSDEDFQDQFGPRLYQDDEMYNSQELNLSHSTRTFATQQQEECPCASIGSYGIC